MIARPDSTPTLSTIDVPTLIVVGSEDVSTPPRDARALHAAIPGSRIEILQQAGHTALDCPMSGTGAQAAVKDLVVYASGGPAAIARLEPAFLAFARKVYDLGAYGNGSKMKFVANHLVAIHNVAAAEAMVLGL